MVTAFGMDPFAAPSAANANQPRCFLAAFYNFFFLNQTALKKKNANCIINFVAFNRTTITQQFEVLNFTGPSYCKGKNNFATISISKGKAWKRGIFSVVYC